MWAECCTGQLCLYVCPCLCTIFHRDLKLVGEWIAFPGCGRRDSPQVGRTPSWQASFTLSRLGLTPIIPLLLALLLLARVGQQMGGWGTLTKGNKNRVQEGRGAPSQLLFRKPAWDLLGWGWGLKEAMNKRPSAGEATFWPPMGFWDVPFPLLWSS